MVYSLGEQLLAKETLALPDIVDILGQRPYPLKASLMEYLQELRDRTTDEKIEKDDAEAKAKELKLAEEEAAEDKKE